MTKELDLKNNFIIEDDPSDTKRRRCCTYHKEYSPLIKRNDNIILPGFVVIETAFLSITQNVFFTCVYMSPCENYKQVGTFCLNQT